MSEKYTVESDTLLAPSIISICALEKRGMCSGCVNFYRHVNFVLFAWIGALRSGSTVEVMSGRSIILSTLFLGNLEAGNQYLAHILLPFNDNCFS